MACPDHYRGWAISYDPPPIPTRNCDWSATHPDFDGPEDNRYVYGSSRADVEAQVDDWLEEHELVEVGDG